jgi:adenine/guanine phosphoribosyltransferase-like PRPP-binding protein
METAINQSIQTSYNFATAAVLDHLLSMLTVSESLEQYKETIEAIATIAAQAYTPAEA